MKFILCKSSKRIEKFKTKLINIPLPPKVKLIRFGSWIEAVNYYVKYFDILKSFIDSLERKENLKIEKLKKLYYDNKLRCDLIYIHSSFGELPSILKALEKDDNSLSESIGLLKKIKKLCKNAQRSFGELLRFKLDKMLLYNIGIEFFEKINHILSGKTVFLFYPSQFIPLFKYLDLTTCTVERSFGTLKRILIGRNNFGEDLLKKYLFLNINK